MSKKKDYKIKRSGKSKQKTSQNQINREHDEMINFWDIPQGEDVRGDVTIMNVLF